MEKATKACYVMRELNRNGFARSADLADAIDERLRVCDGKDTALQVAQWIARNVVTA
jgi:hypothetical protein